MKGVESFLVACLVVITVGSELAASSRGAELVVVDVLERFAAEGAMCSVLIHDGLQQWGPIPSPIPLITFATDIVVSGGALAAAGAACNHHLLWFRRGTNLNGFLVAYEDELRKSGAKYVFITEDRVDAEQLFRLNIMDRLLHVVLFEQVGPDTFAKFTKPAVECQGLKIHPNNFYKKGFHLREEGLFNPSVLDDLACKQFKASTFHFPPFTTMVENGDGSVSLGGTEYRMFAAIAEKLNFKFIVSQWGFCCYYGGTEVEGSGGENHTGMLGDLIDRRADVVWNALYYKADRMEKIDYTAANNFVESGFMVRRPFPLPLWMAPIQPFPATLWLSILGTLFACAMLVVVYALLTGSDTGVYLLTTCGAFVGASCDQLMAANSTGFRIFVGVFLLNIMLVSNVYKSSLISVLTYPPSPSPIDSVEALAKSHLGAVAGGTFLEASMSADPNIQILAERYHVELSHEERVRYLADYESAWVGSLPWLEYFRRLEFTDKHGETIGHILPPFHSWLRGFGLQKESIFTEKFGDLVRHIVESGMDQKWERMEIDRVARIQSGVGGPQRAKLAALVLEQQQSAFVILAIGVAISAAAFTAEMMMTLLKWKRLRGGRRPDAMASYKH